MDAHVRTHSSTHNHKSNLLNLVEEDSNMCVISFIPIKYILYYGEIIHWVDLLSISSLL